MGWRDQARALASTQGFVAQALRTRLAEPAVSRSQDGEHRNRLQRPVVGASSDLERILSLPVRRLDVRDAPEVPLDWLRRENPACACATMNRGACALHLLPLQGHALAEFFLTGGLAAALGVGHGKELICDLLPMVAPGCRTAVLLAPADQRDAFALDWEFYSQHWQLPNLRGGGGPFVEGRPRLVVLYYSELQLKRCTVELERWEPDLIVANESHNLARENVRLDRLLRYMADHPSTRLACLSGTMTKRSLLDFGHLLALALGPGSPLPLEPDALAEWAACVDLPEFGKKLPALPGELRRLCLPGELARDAVTRRVWVETRGCLASSAQSVEVPLLMHERLPPATPQVVVEAIRMARLGTRPDGIELEDGQVLDDGEQMDAEGARARCLRQLASGFFYRWIYPRGEPRELIDRWLACRGAWNNEVREVLQHPVPYFDQPELAEDAAERGLLRLPGDPEHPVWESHFYGAWREIRDLVQPETETLWLSDWLARDAAEWMAARPGICWVATKALGERLARISGAPHYNDRAMVRDLMREDGSRSIICSYKSCGVGKNLQAFHRNLFAEPPPDGALYEQHLGRTHRHGQQAPAVDCWFYLHTAEVRACLARSIAVAGSVVTVEPQRLRYATYTFDRSRL